MSQSLYNNIMEILRKPFPPEVVQQRNHKSKGFYIPAEEYEKRLEEGAGSYWSWYIKGEPLIHKATNEVQVVGTLRILETEREGIGFSTLQVTPEGKIVNLRYGIRAAAQDALRDACDHFQMGWSNLRTNSSNKESSKNEESSSLCMKCKKTLSGDELNFLATNKIKLLYCKEHIPNHFIK
ncbi:hypothetical protein [Bacillus alkalicellulosilyticus]|uniref:hypothetical protein n=1 Tax=Alkalihalobacterium alkalicellulosilyticum TaxID=1912214 RepID=UPI000997D883|nr:hypothetical protein [Bacillus alkalicellulosilyticus]